MENLIHWHKYALIAELARRLSSSGVQFGKTSLQKLIFILQEGYKVDCGYTFELYTYGPFATDILIDLDQVEALDGVCVQKVASGTGGYQILPGNRNSETCGTGADFLTVNKNAIDVLIGTFGNKTAKELELRSTIIFAANESRDNQKMISRNILCEMVKEIKPKFSYAEIFDAIDELEEALLLSEV